MTLAVTLITRFHYWPSGLVGKDGTLYINSLKLDATYDVPPPGNLGWVLLGKLFTLALSPLDAFTLVAILVAVIGSGFFYLLCTLCMRPWLACIATLGLVLSPQVWYHSTTLMSYEVWWVVPAAIAYFGARYISERRLHLLYAAAAATGIGTMLRPDMVAFAGPLLVMFLLLGRAPLARGWCVSAAICGVCCAAWFFGMSFILGGVDIYLETVRSKSEFHDTFSAAAKGAFEGLGRNMAKYALMFLWGAAFVTPLAALAALSLGRYWRKHWRFILLGLIALAPNLYFAWWIFMGNAGLVLPGVATAFLLAGWWCQRTLAQPGTPGRRAHVVMGLVGLLGAAQFVLTPILPTRSQRDVVINVTLFKYSGQGIRRVYNDNLADYGVDASLANSLRQLRHPEPLPPPPPKP